MQVNTALRHDILVPWQKRKPEDLKTGLQLLAADKGGLVYNPIAGLHEHVAELDFTAMYPSIMVRFNLSPETVGTACCEGTPVPEIDTPVCAHRRGLVPETLAPLLEKRRQYKARLRQLPDDDSRRVAYRRRYSAHKWLLVTCFGYLGYKNARFGRIEAHEAVTAYGREVLLQAKEMVEGHGFRVLHLYVDGLWIHRPGAAQRPDYESLLAEIQARTGLEIGLEGIYRWVAFLPSRTEPRVSAANRYFGAFEDGEIKVRGIEYRRHDTPRFIKETQWGMLEMLAQGEGIAGFRRQLPQAIAYARQRLQHLRAGEVSPHELVVTHRLSRDPGEFRVRTVAARVARELTQAGIALSPGENLRPETRPTIAPPTPNCSCGRSRACCSPWAWIAPCSKPGCWPMPGIGAPREPCRRRGSTDASRCLHALPGRRPTGSRRSCWRGPTPQPPSLPDRSPPALPVYVRRSTPPDRGKTDCARMGGAWPYPPQNSSVVETRRCLLPRSIGRPGITT
jgi:DNA polymerase-2